MGLYDVIGEISNAQNLKTATGDNRIWGVIVGTVTANYSETLPGRVCVQIPTRGSTTNSDAEDNTLKWARVACNTFGTNWGTYFMPEVGDEVLLVFEQGNIEKPYVIGCLSTNKSKLLTNQKFESEHLENNAYKTVATKHGSHITFYDSDDENNGTDGELDKITIQTANSSKYQQIELDNENQSITLLNKAAKNSMVMKGTSSDDGELTVTISHKMTMKIGDNITITANGETGKVLIKAKSIDLETMDNMTLKSDKNVVVKADGGSTSIKASQSVQVKGSSVSIGDNVSMG